MKTRLIRSVSLLFAINVMPATSAASAASVDAAAPFDDACVAYEHNQWPEAFAKLAALADAGHPHAAQMAFLMWKQGEALYGMRFEPTLEQLQRWHASMPVSPYHQRRLAAN